MKIYAEFQINDSYIEQKTTNAHVNENQQQAVKKQDKQKQQTQLAISHQQPINIQILNCFTCGDNKINQHYIKHSNLCLKCFSQTLKYTDDKTIIDKKIQYINIKQTNKELKEQVSHLLQTDTLQLLQKIALIKGRINKKKEQLLIKQEQIEHQKNKRDSLQNDIQCYQTQVYSCRNSLIQKQQELHEQSSLLQSRQLKCNLMQKVYITGLNSQLFQCKSFLLQNEKQKTLTLYILMCEFQKMVQISNQVRHQQINISNWLLSAVELIEQMINEPDYHLKLVRQDINGILKQDCFVQTSLSQMQQSEFYNIHTSSCFVCGGVGENMQKQSLTELQKEFKSYNKPQPYINESVIYTNLSNSNVEVQNKNYICQQCILHQIQIIHSKILIFQHQFFEVYKGQSSNCQNATFNINILNIHNFPQIRKFLQFIDLRLICNNRSLINDACLDILQQQVHELDTSVLKKFIQNGQNM